MKIVEVSYPFARFTEYRLFQGFLTRETSKSRQSFFSISFSTMFWMISPKIAQILHCNNVGSSVFYLPTFYLSSYLVVEFRIFFFAVSQQNVIIELFLIFWTFCQISFSWGSYFSKLPKFPISVTRTLNLFTNYFWFQKFLKRISTKQTLRSGFMGQLKVLRIFNPIPWSQGLKIRPFWHCIYNDTKSIARYV